ncbi:MAG: hypothetical protein ACXWUG_24880 [Polyangiales bacterium]
MMLSPRFLAVTLTTAGFGLALSFGCEPRHKAATAPTNTVAAATTTAPATGTVQPTATTTATAPATGTTPPATATAPTATATAPTVGAWPTAVPGFDPNVVADWAKKAGEMGFPIPGGVPAATPGGDPIEAAIKANAAKNAPGFAPASSIGRATLKTGEHAGMNFTMQQGKCYVVFGAGATGVTQLGLNLLFPATPPNAAIASDTGNGANPVLGAGKPLCPPVQSPVRVDAVAMAGAGNVGVQVYVK